jgi:hypothetical protein
LPGLKARPASALPGLKARPASALPGPEGPSDIERRIPLAPGNPAADSVHPSVILDSLRRLIHQSPPTDSATWPIARRNRATYRCRCRGDSRHATVRQLDGCARGATRLCTRRSG